MKIDILNDAPAGYIRNSEGHLVPSDKVKVTDKLEDEIVLSLVQTAANLNTNLSEFKSFCFGEINGLLDVLASEYKITKGGKKGNLTLTSYDGRFKVQLSVAQFLDFGPNLQIAKQLIDECIHEWSNGSNENIRALVDHAFRVDKANRVNTKDILGLRRLEIQDEQWQKAMNAIADSIRVTSSKEYVRFYYRPSPEADWSAISLDIAKVETIAGAK